MSDENNNGRTPSPPGGRAPLTLKPRGAGSVSAGTVKQSFSHGRSKTVVVETKRSRTHLPGGGGNLAAPSSAEKRLFEPRPAPAPAPRAPADGLSAEERAARQRVLEAAQERQAAERRAAEERARAEAAAAPARAPTPAAEAPARPPAAAPAPATPAAPAPVAAAAAPAPAAPRATAPPAGPGQTRTYQPSADRRDDRASTTT